MFNDNLDTLVPIKEAKIIKPLNNILNQLTDKNNVSINNVKVREFFNKVSDSGEVVIKNTIDN